MRHHRARSLFAGAVDDALTGRQLRRLETHLHSCTSCAEEFRLYELTHQLLAGSSGDAAEEELSAGFTDTVIAQLRREGVPQSGAPRARWGQARLAIGAAALVLLWLWGDRLHSLPEMGKRYSRQEQVQGQERAWAL